MVTQDPHRDDRGRFARVYCKREFAERGIAFDVVQVNRGLSTAAGTLRGLHYMPAPMNEPKLVHCSMGAIYDVIVDARPESPTYMTHFGIELTSRNGKMLFVPGNCAHGYITLEDNSEISYMAGAYYKAGAEVGMRYDDPRIGISWPRPVEVINERDRNWPYLNGADE